MALIHLYLGSLNVCTELLGPAKTVAMVALSSSCASRRSSPKHWPSQTRTVPTLYMGPYGGKNWVISKDQTTGDPPPCYVNIAQ